MQPYKWNSTFSKGNKVNKHFVKKIFSILNNGTVYTDINGKFMGYINALEGPLGVIHFISDHSFDSDNYKFVRIKVIYLNKDVLYFVIGNDSLTNYTFITGHWANCVQRCS